MKKPFAIIHKNKRKPFEFFEYPEQAGKYMKKYLGGSPYFKMIDLRKKKR